MTRGLEALAVLQAHEHRVSVADEGTAYCTVCEALAVVRAELEEHRDAVVWFEDHMVDEDGEPAELTVPQMLQHVFDWGDGAWGHAGRATADLEERNELLGRILDHADAGYHEHLARRAAYTSRATEGGQE